MCAFRDLTGQKFGRWTVLRRAPNSDKGATMWVATCHCSDAEKHVRAADLLKGASQSCGCWTAHRHLISGQKFGRWTAVKQAPNNKRGRTCWLCVCECGATEIIEPHYLISGHTRSCGCWKLQQQTKHGHCRNGKESPEYHAWHDMKYRCLNPKHPHFKLWGGRGIAICNRWLHGESGKSGFECFYEDMGQKPSPHHSLDRIDNDGDYEPANCRWATQREQTNDSRRNHSITMAGRTQSIADWARELGFPYKWLRDLVVYGEKLIARTERKLLAQNNLKD